METRTRWQRSSLPFMLAAFAAAAPFVAACGGDGGTPEGDGDAAVDAADGSATDDTGEADGDAGTDDTADRDADVSSHDTDDTDADGPDPDEGEDTDDGSGEADAGTAWPDIARTPPQPGVDPLRWDPMDGAAAGVARGGVVREGTAPFFGPEARCRPGDLVLANERLHACIAATSMSQILYAGGNLVDVMPAGIRGPDYFELLAPASGLRAGGGDVVELIADGSDGGPAVVRTSGVDVLAKIVGSILGNFSPDPLLQFETEYRLAPGAAAIEIVTWVRSDRASAFHSVDLGDLVMPGDGVSPWAPGIGIFSEVPRLEIPLYVASSPHWAVGIAGESMVLTSIAPGLLDAQVNPLQHARGRLARGDEAAYTRYVSVGRDTTALRLNFADHVPPVVGDLVAVRASGLPPGRDGRYEIFNSADESVAIVHVVDAGEARLLLPPGNYALTPVDALWEDRPTTDFVVAGETEVTFVAPAYGTLVVTVASNDGGDAYPSPALVRLSGAMEATHYVTRGRLAIPVPPGTYTVELSRGDAYSLELRTDVDVTAGASTDVAATLTRVWDTAGMVAGDFHQHQLRSVDSSVFNDDRVRSNLAAGLEVFSPSDHDVVEDFGAVVDALDVRDLLFPITGSEISPVWGHMNAFPTPWRPELPAGGAVALSERSPGERAIRTRTAPELVAEARRLGARVVQVNHPRSSSGMFNSAEFDPIDGPDLVNAEYWPGDFDSIEVFNGPGDTCEVLHDWFSLLSRGWRVAGFGNSDTHSLNTPVGFPRNFLGVPTTDPAALDEDMIADAIDALDVTVSGGLLIDFPEGHRPGDTLSLPEVAPDAEGAFPVRVRVQSTQWSSANTLLVFVNGVETQRVALSPGTPTETVDFNDVVTVDLERDSHVVFFAYGDARMANVTPGETPFGFTNPLFIDVDGDGWTPPGVDGAASLPAPTGIPFCR